MQAAAYSLLPFQITWLLLCNVGCNFGWCESVSLGSKQYLENRILQRRLSNIWSDPVALQGCFVGICHMTSSHSLSFPQGSVVINLVVFEVFQMDLSCASWIDIHVRYRISLILNLLLNQWLGKYSNSMKFVVFLQGIYSLFFLFKGVM